MKKRTWKQFVNRNIALGLLLGMLNSMLFADIKVDKGVPQNTSVDRAQNGANIIDINTPNNRGISVNDFSEFRTKDPTVFNNFGQGVGRSYLAGMMAANPNLTKEQAARLILNRVGGSNRVEIENWLGVAPFFPKKVTKYEFSPIKIVVSNIRLYHYFYDLIEPAYFLYYLI